jgi:hypothetical protein
MIYDITPPITDRLQVGFDASPVRAILRTL